MKMRGRKIARAVGLTLSYGGFALLLALLRKKITLSLGSLSPLICAGIMMVQFLLYRCKREGETVDVHVYSRLTRAEKEKYDRHFADWIVCFLPFQLALIFFLSDPAKIVLSVAVYFAAILGIEILWRFWYGGEVKARIRREKREQEEQIKREGEGQYR